MKNWIFIAVILVVGLPAGGMLHAQRTERLCRDTSGEYAFMWWVNTIKENNPRTFAVKTNRFGFIFDAATLNFQHLFIRKDIRPAEEIRKLSTQAIFEEPMVTPVVSFGTEINGTFNPCTKVSAVAVSDVQVIHSGRFMQHRFINNIAGLTGCEPKRSGLDMVSWPDRLSLILRITPATQQIPRHFVMRLAMPSDFQEIASEPGYKVFRHPATGCGYVVIVPDTGGTQLTVTGNQVEVRLLSENPTMGEISVGLVVYPVPDLDAALPGIVRQEKNLLNIPAQQLSPTVIPPDAATYNRQMGWYEIKLRNDHTGDMAIDNDRLEKVRFTINNTGAEAQTVRLNFSKKDAVYGITGISAVLMDEEGYPTGIPVQLSKNWHTVDFQQYEKHRYRGIWYHGLTMLTLPPGTGITLEYAGVNAHWGGVPAASHAQLCLVGWGANQLWDESAVGSWGESICYEPDLDQSAAPVLDVRPLQVVGKKGEKWGWTGNVGGADFFNVYKTDGKRAWHTAMKTDYKRYCPNLTDVVYEGEMFDGNVTFSYEASTGRTNDITRGFYRLRMDVKKDIAFDELDIFQMTAAAYHYNTSKKFAVGNENGLLKDWIPQSGGSRSQRIGKKEPLTGRVPWGYLYDTQLSPDQVDRFLPADRGFALRRWDAKIKGRPALPHWQEYFSTEANHGHASLIAVTVPEGCKSLSAGDYIEAEIELFVIPRKAQDYYGTNTPLTTALQKWGGAWQMACREAVGNDISVTVNEGIVERQYPVVIRAVDDKAHFTIKGGMGYVPITIKGVSAYRVPALSISPSEPGNDFRQTDFDPASGTWEFTYNVNSDSEGDKATERKFRFEIKNFPSNVQDSTLEPFAVYPNPATDSVTVSGLQSNEAIRIFDQQGRVWHIRKATGSTETIAVNQLPKGIYIVHIGTQALELVKK